METIGTILVITFWSIVLYYSWEYLLGLLLLLGPAVFPMVTSIIIFHFTQQSMFSYGIALIIVLPLSILLLLGVGMKLGFLEWLEKRIKTKFKRGY